MNNALIGTLASYYCTDNSMLYGIVVEVNFRNIIVRFFDSFNSSDHLSTEDELFLDEESGYWYVNGPTLRKQPFFKSLKRITSQTNSC